jgi:hypothetical protein
VRAAVALLFCTALTVEAIAQPAVPLSPARTNPSATIAPSSRPPSVAPKILSDVDAALYRQIMTAARAGELTKARQMMTRVSDPVLNGYGEAIAYLSLPRSGLKMTTLTAWLEQYRDTAIADRIYRVAVANSTRTVRRGKKRIKVAVVTNIPAPRGVGSRTGGYEDIELAEPTPSSDVGKAVMPSIFTAIRAGKPDEAESLLESVRATATPHDIAILSHRVAASYRAEGRDSDAYRIATSVSDPGVPQLMWDSGFAAYRMGRWADAVTILEKLSETAAARTACGPKPPSGPRAPTCSLAMR